MPAGGGDLEGEAAGRVPAHVGQVGRGRSARRRRGRGGRGPRALAPEGGEQLAEVGHGADHVAADERASAAHSAGTTTASVASAPTRGTIPGTRRTEPSRPSSPTKPMPATASGASSPPATSTPTAMARSTPAPFFFRPDGARFTVTLRGGHGTSAVEKAARARSRASRQAVSGRPTTVKAGRPLPTWTSTVTGWPSTPRRVADGMVASTGLLPGCGSEGEGRAPAARASGGGYAGGVTGTPGGTGGPAAG